MAQRPTIRDVARVAGTSIGSVSNYLNNTTRVSVGTRKRIEDAIDALGFIPNSAVRVVLGARSHAIGFLTPDVPNPSLLEIQRGIEDVAIQAQDVVIVCNTDCDPAREAHYARTLSEMRVTGAIVMASSAAETHMRTLEASGAVVVLIDADPRRSHFPTINSDNVQGGRIAMEHLLERGHRDIVFVGGPGAEQAVKERLAGAKAAFVNAGLDPAAIRRVDARGGSFASRSAAAEEVLQMRPRPTAALCANDLIALAFQNVLLANHIRVPQDMALVGYDDIEAGQTAPVPLTTVHQSSYEQGKAAAELVLEIAAHGTATPRPTFPVELIVRQST